MCIRDSSRRCPKLARNQKPRTAAARSRTRRARRSRGTGAPLLSRARRSGRAPGAARHRSRRREPPPWFVCAAETDEEKSSAQTGRRRRNCFSRIRSFHFWKCKPFFPRHRKGADGPRKTHSHAHVLRNNPFTHASHSKCLSVRLSSRTRTCPRCVSVASRGTARFPSLPHAEMECLCGLFCSPRKSKHLPATVPSAALDRPRDARLTSSIPPHRCFVNNRTSSRMPWTAPPRCVSSRLESVGFWN